ncbi:MAG: BMP family ABC transporter substrate-binding protein [Bdellovibrionota bacterium]
MKLKFLLFIFIVFFNANALAEEPRVCLILDKGGKDDKSFNQSAYEGFLKAKKDFSLSSESKYVTVREDAQSSQFIRTFSTEKCGLIIAIGFNNADVVGQIAPQFPAQNYAVVDSSVKGNNIRAITFEEHEGAFLMGAIAAIKTKTQKVGFVGGMEIPLIKRFQMGFEAGAKYINPKIQVSQSFVGVTSSAWNNPTKAKELALSMYGQQGIDIIFVAAGASSQGVFDAVEQANKNVTQVKKYVIGVDSNQNYIAPGMVLTSMEKKVDFEVYKTIESFVEKKFTSGVMTYGFKDGGVNWALDKYNQNLFTSAEIHKINLIKTDVIKGKIQVPDYYKVIKTTPTSP